MKILTGGVINCIVIIAATVAIFGDKEYLSFIGQADPHLVIKILRTECLFDSLILLVFLLALLLDYLVVLDRASMAAFLILLTPAICAMRALSTFSPVLTSML